MSCRLRSIGDAASLTERGVKQKSPSSAVPSGELTEERRIHEVRRSILRQLSRRMAEIHGSVTVSDETHASQVQHDQDRHYATGAIEKLGPTDRRSQ